MVVRERIAVRPSPAGRGRVRAVVRPAGPSLRMAAAGRLRAENHLLRLAVAAAAGTAVAGEFPSPLHPSPASIPAAPSAAALSKALLLWMRTVLPGGAVELLVVDAAAGALEVVATHRFNPERGLGCRIPVGVGVTGRAARNGRAVWVTDVRRSRHYIPAVDGAIWEWALPLLGPDGRVAAVLDVESSGRRPDRRARRRLRHLVRLVAPAFAAAMRPVPTAGAGPVPAGWTAPDVRLPPPAPSRPTPPVGAALSGPLLGGLIAGGGIHTLFLPVYDLRDGRLMGAEALTRGEPGGPLESPLALFAAAGAAGRLPELDLACIRSALAAWPRGSGWLFLNIHPATLRAPEAARQALRLVRRRLGEEPPGAGVVIEVTEHERSTDAVPWVRRAARSSRVRVAVDDFGSGYANAQGLLELRPAYVKLDAALVRGVDGDFGRRTFIESLCYYTRRTRTRLIAEGIETEAELAAVRRCGVPLGQGFLFGRPGGWPAAAGGIP